MSRFTGQVAGDGKTVKFDAPVMWLNALSKLKGKRVSVLIEREFETRTNPQNRRFWAVVVPVCREVLNQELEKQGQQPWSKDTVHEKLEEWILGHEDTALGPVRRRCSQLDTAGFSKFMEDIEQLFWQRWKAVFPSEDDVRETGL